VIEATLCYLLRPGPRPEVLLGLKKAGFGAGKLDGIGGKIEPGETAAQAAAREVAEEIRVHVEGSHLVPAGDIHFLFPANHAMEHHVFLFRTTEWKGEPIETDEIRPEWFPLDAIPWERMWADAVHWLLRVLEGDTVVGEIAFQNDNERVASVSLTRGTAAPDSAATPRERRPTRPQRRQGP
jgi:8-oxo-dGTP diphosphatase